METLQKIKLSEANITLWRVTFNISKFYNKNDYTLNKARRHFMSLVDEEGGEDYTEESDDDWYLSTEFSYYACDSGHGGNIINDCLNAIREDGIEMDEFPDYEYQWNKIESSQDYQEHLSYGLSTYGRGIKIEDDFLLGECLSEFIDNCSCKNNC